MDDNFSEISLKSILFKGRTDLFFCYLKSEKIAHVLVVLQQRAATGESEQFEELVSLAAHFPNTFLHFVAGEVAGETILADLLSLISMVRLCATENIIQRENSLVLCQEYENIARKIIAENHPSPFISSKDFSIEEVRLAPTSKALFSEPYPAIEQKRTETSIKDIDKGHSERKSLILDLVKKNKGISIKEIAAVVKGCSEKTIQRELSSLIEEGLVERQGERRWSVYISTI
jgi:DNA-binding transcriptional ArsR family regulator